MRALRYEGPGKILPVEVPDPDPGPDEVLLEPLTVGICFTDKLAHASPDFQSYPPGTVLGHEFCGRVVELGDAVEGVMVGDLVAPDPRVFCGECLGCRSGYLGQCSTVRGWVGVHGGWQGALAERVKVPARSIHHFTAGLTPAGGACVEPFAFSLRQVRHLRPAWGDNIVLLGAEDYGLAEAALLAPIAGRLVVADPYAHRREAALRFGAHEAIDATPGLVDEVRARFPFGADLVVVNAEAYLPRSETYLAEAYEMARPGATVLVSRSSGGRLYPAAPSRTAWAKELDIRYFGGCFGEEPWRGGRDRGDWEVAIRAIDDRRLDPEALGATVVRFDDLRTGADVDELMELLPAHATKVFVEVGTTGP